MKLSNRIIVVIYIVLTIIIVSLSYGQGLATGKRSICKEGIPMQNMEGEIVCVRELPPSSSPYIYIEVNQSGI